MRSPVPNGFPGGAKDLIKNGEATGLMRTPGGLSIVFTLPDGSKKTLKFWEPDHVTIQPLAPVPTDTEEGVEP